MCVCVFKDETIIKIITIWRFKDTQKENNFIEKERETHRHKGIMVEGTLGIIEEVDLHE